MYKNVNELPEGGSFFCEGSERIFIQVFFQDLSQEEKSMTVDRPYDHDAEPSFTADPF